MIGRRMPAAPSCSTGRVALGCAPLPFGGGVLAGRTGRGAMRAPACEGSGLAAAELRSRRGNATYGNPKGSRTRWRSEGAEKTRPLAIEASRLLRNLDLWQSRGSIHCQYSAFLSRNAPPIANTRFSSAVEVPSDISTTNGSRFPLGASLLFELSSSYRRNGSTFATP